MDTLRELWYFFLANLRASYFGAFLLTLFLVSEFIAIPLITRFDFIFLAAVTYQIATLLFRLETPKEFLVIIIFHALATIMELYKTHPSIGSWTYPGVEETFFAIGTVPLFTGFLYSAVGSYISRAFQILHLQYLYFPPFYHISIVASLIYFNFFTHHFWFDLRYLLFFYIAILFWRTEVRFLVHKKQRRLPFLVTAFLTAFFIWIAENISTFSRIWLYPSQVDAWHPVSVEKMGSWFLLLILNFALVALLYKTQLIRKTL